jgi:molybdopterin synthase sulfur carrier subunit
MQARTSEIEVTIPSALRPLCAGRAALRLPARDVRSLLEGLKRRHPELHGRLCDERGEPRPHINVFVNEEHVRWLRGLDTPLTADDVVTILPAVSGG